MTKLMMGIYRKNSIFFFSGENKIFFRRCVEIDPDGELGLFIDFLALDYARRILMESKLFIHIDCGNVYYDGQNTNYSIYDFFFNHKDKAKNAGLFGNTFKIYDFFFQPKR